MLVGACTPDHPGSPQRLSLTRFTGHLRKWDRAVPGGSPHPEGNEVPGGEPAAVEAFQFIHAEKAHHDVGVLWRMLGVSRSGY